MKGFVWDLYGMLARGRIKRGDGTNYRIEN